SKFKNIKVAGIFTHLASAEVNSAYTWKQISDFEYSSFLASESVQKHVLNSSGVIYFSGAGFDMARPGLMIYGLNNSKEEKKTVNLKPALSWKTKVLMVKDCKKGSSISYGNTYKTKRDTKIAVLGIGYGAGYNRLLSNKGGVLINGKNYPLRGRVCMDLTMVELGRNSKVKAGDTAVLLGRSKNKIISAENLAGKCKTIPYEIVCAIKKDIKRVYI
ncbi:MAG: alanine racemase, partial [Candidatus Firestonebacteria bacterium]